MSTQQPHPASPEARSKVVLGVIGGSGLYSMDELEEVEVRTLETPFGAPSGPFTVGKLPRGEGREPLTCVFVSRHGPGHLALPGELNYRANIWGLKQLGVTHLLAASAVGSLREAIVPGHAVVPDQLIDRTKHRETTFFGGGCVAHVQFGDPMDAGLRDKVLEAAEAVIATDDEAELHRDGTLLVMEGPAFSTRAESELYRSWGCDIIGMTALPEAKLAREAEMAYALLATATDYDCWHLSEEEVTVDAVIAIMKANVARVRKIILELATRLPESCEELPWPRALAGALITDPTKIPPATRVSLELIVGHYLSA
ncbi:S-methyl-5'-thioadenosine phosphorylase [Plesiocystis pacifica]|nr:S-methyl-5'-thioadenosine phosphorylase [Plesiocystis pacifica]